MSTSGTPSFPPDSSQLIGAICCDFSDAIASGTATAIEDYSDQIARLGPSLFVALLNIELQVRMRRGQPLEKREYLNRFPEFHSQIHAAFSDRKHLSDVSNSEAANLDLSDTQVSERQVADVETQTLESGALDDGAQVAGTLGGSFFSDSAHSFESDVSDAPTSISAFRIVRELGRGGMGVVYLAVDMERGETVALKTMLFSDASRLARFKKEFRSLADVSHPNLVKLYKLVVDQPQCYFTMEYVDGESFLRHVRRGLEPHQPLPEDRLVTFRELLKQLVDGVIALHRAGKIHRDIKSSNVLVTKGGRVVIVDFGLAAETDLQGEYETVDGHAVGTPAYMSPEQAMGKAITSASDWYGIGVLIYQTLTGQLPISGTAIEMLIDKQSAEKHRIDTRGMPSDLGEICRGLLQLDPIQRFSGEEVKERLGDVTDPAVTDEPPQVFVGRQSELDFLLSRFQSLGRNQATRVLLSGVSGSGKSSLIDRFIRCIDGEPELIVLKSRCYEGEAVPFKAIDSLVDALAKYLSRLSYDGADALLPRDVYALACVFPSLKQVEAVRDAVFRHGASAVDQAELRRSAFVALRELLVRLGDRKRLVIIIDDLQWGDRDGAELLASVLRQPDGPCTLFLGSYRSEDHDSSVAVRCLLEGPSEFHQISLQNLNEDQAYELARELLMELVESPQREIIARAIAAESNGNPIFISELARDASNRPQTLRTECPLSLPELIWRRVGSLGEEQRNLLYCLSIAGQPLPEAILVAASDVTPDRTSFHLMQLRHQHLIRNCSRTDEDRIDTYHDRIRETILPRIRPERKQLFHRRLAELAESADAFDPEFLADQFQEAGDQQRAHKYYVHAADETVRKLAFNRAIELYDAALRSGSESDSDYLALRVRRAQCLGLIGKRVESATEYLELATKFDFSRSLDLRRRAFNQLHFMGRVDDASTVLEELLSETGFRVPGTRLGVLSSIAALRLVLAYYLIRRRDTEADWMVSSEAQKSEVLWVSSASYSLINPLMGSYFAVRHAVNAFRSADRDAMAKAIAMEAGHRAAIGPRSANNTEKLNQLAHNLSQQSDDPVLSSIVDLCTGIRSGLIGEWQECIDHCQKVLDATEPAKAALVKDVSASSHSFDTLDINTTVAQFWRLYAFSWKGRFGALQEECPPLFERAQATDDFYLQANIGTFSLAMTRLSQDQAAMGLEEIREAMANWRSSGFQVQEILEASSQVILLLFLGDYATAEATLRNIRSPYRKSLVWAAHVVRTKIRFLSSLVALHRYADNPRDRRAGWALQRYFYGFAYQPSDWTRGLPLMINATKQLIDGRDVQAEKLYRKAIVALQCAGLDALASVSSRRLGLLIQGEEGRQLVEASEHWMRQQRVASSEKLTQMFAPLHDGL